MVVAFFGSTILAVVLLRFIPVYFTPLMFIRCAEQIKDGESIKMHHHWVPLDKISPHLPVAVMASEDQRFLLHHGFDYKAIEKPWNIICRARKAWCKHHIAADCKERVPVAGPFMDTQRFRSLFYNSDRTDVEQAADNGSLS